MHENFHDPAQRVRIGMVQWPMRHFAQWSDFDQATHHQVRALANAGANFILFPEYFAVPLALLAPQAEANHAPADHEIAQLHWLANQAGRIRAHFSELAHQYRLYLVAGSTLEWVGHELRNASYFCHPDGRVETHYKLHLTPWEAGYWGISPGREPGLFDTHFGKVAVCICYDVEFPELPRWYALAGAQILFVPFSTDTEQGYYRVRHCAQARAIENELYVVLAGCVGNLPESPQVEYQYGQAALLTPSDYGFPPRGIQVESPANQAAALVGEVNLAALQYVRDHGSVRNLRDRRPELYQLDWETTVKV